jgi:transcriptional regulator with XRE-family HTH domain
MKIGRGIKKARVKRYTQVELASLTGVTNSYVSLVENGKRGVSMSWLEKVSYVTDVSIPWIVFESMDEKERVEFDLKYKLISQDGRTD